MPLNKETKPNQGIEENCWHLDSSKKKATIRSELALVG